MKIKTKIEYCKDEDQVNMIACESKNGITAGMILGGMPKDMYESFVEMFGRDPSYQELLDMIHEMERRHK